MWAKVLGGSNPLSRIMTDKEKILQLEAQLFLQQQEFDRHEREWFQIIEDWTNKHPCSQREAAKFLKEKFYSKRKDKL